MRAGAATMIELDGTLHKIRLGANATLGVSLAAARAAAIRSAGAWLSDEQMPAYLYKTAAQPFSRLTAAVARTFSGRVSQCHSAPSSSTACAQAASKPLFLVRLCVASASVETSSQHFSS